MNNFDYDDHFQKLLSCMIAAMQSIMSNYTGITITLNTVNSSDTPSGKSIASTLVVSNARPANPS